MEEKKNTAAEDAVGEAEISSESAEQSAADGLTANAETVPAEQSVADAEALAADELIANVAELRGDVEQAEAEKAEVGGKRKRASRKKPETCEEREEDNGKFFKKFKIRDIVFLAIITACTFVLGVPMPFVKDVPLFGIIQLVLGLQFSILPVIGMMKVRKPGALLFQSAFLSIFLVFMFPPMAFLVLCGLIAEGVAMLIFRGYKNDWACVVAGTVYLPLTLPFMYLYTVTLYSNSEKTYTSLEIMLGMNNPWMVVGMTVAIIALCFVGSVIGMVIARELRKAGKLK